MRPGPASYSPLPHLVLLRYLLVRVLRQVTLAWRESLQGQKHAGLRSAGHYFLRVIPFEVRTTLSLQIRSDFYRALERAMTGSAFMLPPRNERYQVRLI